MFLCFPQSQQNFSNSKSWENKTLIDPTSPPASISLWPFCQGVGADFGEPRIPPGLTGLLRSADRSCFPSTCSRNLRRASSSVALCPALPSLPRTRPLSRASRWPRGEKKQKKRDYLGVFSTFSKTRPLKRAARCEKEWKNWIIWELCPVFSIPDPSKGHLGGLGVRKKKEKWDYLGVFPTFPKTKPHKRAARWPRS